MDFPHEPAEPRKAIEPPALDSLVRGIALLAGALAAGLAGGRLVRSGFPAIALAPFLWLTALWLAWAGAVQAGGGARFDDHPWV